MKYLPKILIGLFAVIVIIFSVVIFKLVQMDSEAFLTEEINSKVISIRGGYKGEPNYKIMELESGQSFTIPDSMLNVLQIGDSVYKNKGESFYTFIPKTK